MGPERPKSIEELKRIQADYGSSEAAEADAAAGEPPEPPENPDDSLDATLRAKVEEDRAKRMDLIGQAAEAHKAREGAYDDAEYDSSKETPEAATAAIDEIKRWEEYLAELEEIVKGKERVAPEVFTSIREARELIRKNKIFEANARIREIEGNPYVMEKLEEEAQLENKIRDKIVQDVLNRYYCYQEGKKEQMSDFVGLVCNTFISEQLDKLGVNSERDSNQALSRLRGFQIQIERGMTDYVNLKQLKAQSTQDTYGIALTGYMIREIFDTREGKNNVDSFLTNSQEFRNHWDWLPWNTVNVIRAYTSGLQKSHQAEFLPGWENWSRFDQSVTQGDRYEIEKSGLIHPKGIKGPELDGIRQSFERNKTQAEEIDREMTEKDSVKTERRRTELEEKIAQLKKVIADYDAAFQSAEEEAKASSKPFTGLTYDLVQAKENETYQLEERRKGLETQIRNNRESLSRAGFFAFGDKRDLNDRITGAESNIHAIDRDLSKIRPRLEMYKKALDQVTEAQHQYSKTSVQELKNLLGKFVGELEGLNQGR